MQNEERIAVLELQYRTMKRIVLGVSWVISLNFAICSLIIVGYFVSTTNAPDLIQARKFEVVNDEGIILADIFSDVAGDGQLRIFDREGKQFARIFLGDEGNGGLGIYNKDSKYEVAQLGVYDGWGVLGIYDKDGGVVARLRAANYGTSENGGGLLKIFNKDFKEVVHIGVDENGNGVVQTKNVKDEVISAAPSDELCCQHPHHLECIVNTASAPPGSCQHSHHLECGVTNSK